MAPAPILKSSERLHQGLALRFLHVTKIPPVLLDKISGGNKVGNEFERNGKQAVPFLL
jgi:hypothetical protein